jgi:hypothetical protein
MQALHKIGVTYFLVIDVGHRRSGTSLKNGWMGVRSNVDGEVTKPSVSVLRNATISLYQHYGRQEDCRIELFDCAHEETPEMRSLVIDWTRRYLTAG